MLHCKHLKDNSVCLSFTIVGHLYHQIRTLIAIRLSLLLTLLLLELHVTMVHHSTSQFVNAHLLFISEAQDVNSVLYYKTF